MSSGIAPDNVSERVFDWLEKRLWNPGRRLDPETVADPGDVLDGRPSRLSTDDDLDNPSLSHEMLKCCRHVDARSPHLYVDD